MSSPSSVRAVAAGYDHTCALLGDGTVRCWGKNDYGQLGYGDDEPRGDSDDEMGGNLPIVDLGGRTIEAITAGDYHTCALVDDGSVRCWGRNDSGQLGYGETEDLGDEPGEMGDNQGIVDLGSGRRGSRTAKAITAGENHTCALLDDDTVKCWGDGEEGQLGYGDDANRGDQPGEMGDALPTIDLGTRRSARAVVAGYNHTCALLDNSAVKCWGSNSDGQLGYGDFISRGDEADEMGDVLPTVDLGTRRSATSLTTSSYHTCALLDDATIKCWGSNPYGQLGYGDTIDRGGLSDEMGDNLLAVDLGTGRTATAVSAGSSHTCAVLDDGTVKCWGSNFYAQLGYGDNSETNDFDRGDDSGEMGEFLPTVLLGTGRTAKTLATGDGHTCALLDDDTVKCWGYNTDGVLGYGDTEWRGDDPGETGDSLPIVSFRTARMVVAGNSHTCALLDDGTVRCWGFGRFGQLGYGDTADRGDGPGEMGRNLPVVDLGDGRTAKTIAAGEYHTCAILDDDTVKCWGYNLFGQLGYGDTEDRGDGPGEMGDNLPAVDLGAGRKGPRTAKAVIAGANHTCAILDDDTVKCWGWNEDGQLGYGDTEDRGDGPGEMGNDLPAVDLGTSRPPRAIVAGFWHTCALLANGAVKCWGDGGEGQLGYGDTAVRGDGPGEMGRNLPTVDLGPRRTATAVVAGFEHNCALLDNGSVKCWGYNGDGELGLGTDDRRGDGPAEMGANLPAVDLGPGRTARAIFAGFYHTCALLDDSTVKCWGWNSDGQLGYGDQSSRGDEAGEMGANLPAVDLGDGRIATRVTGGLKHTCALLDNSTVKCWGRNVNGQLGYGDQSDRGDEDGEMGDVLHPVLLTLIALT